MLFSNMIEVKKHLTQVDKMILNHMIEEKNKHLTDADKTLLSHLM